MAEQAWQAKDYQGLTPALDARRTNQVFVLDGSRNLAFTAAGPKSAFGNRWLLPQPLGEPSHVQGRSEEHTSELQSPMRISYAVFCLKKKKQTKTTKSTSYRSNCKTALIYTSRHAI